MKKILSIFSLMVGLITFAQKIPTTSKTEFIASALQENVQAVDGSSFTLNQVLDQYKGNIVILDLWATWCGDCIKAMPKLKELNDKNPDVKFIYLSMDKTEDAWRNGMEKYHLEGHHFYMGNNWKSEFASYIDLNWIPRYLVLDKEGKIAKYYAVKAEDPDVQATIDRLRI